jgi:hypothetical protein
LGINPGDADMTHSRETALIARLDASIPLQLAHINALKILIANGSRHSNQDGDVRQAAQGAIGKSEIAPYAARWVEVMTAPGAGT